MISGGPGTGKTTTVVLILECLLEENEHLSVYLAAPTGKATSRMRQSIAAMTQGPIADNFPRMKEVVAQDEAASGGRRVEEHTIHKWLVKKTPAGEKPSAGNPLAADVLIIDEASMVDIHLAARALRGGLRRDARHHSRATSISSPPWGRAPSLRTSPLRTGRSRRTRSN